MFTETNTWFYTLSTISQTCAAILALGATFVVFKLDKVKIAIDNYRGRVVRLLQLWHRGEKAPDKFFDEPDEKIIEQYITSVIDSDEDVFDRNGVIELYELFEGVRLNYAVSKDAFIMSNGIKLDHEERKRWCNRMAHLMKKNVILNNRIYNYLRFSIISLAMSIIISVGLLIAKPLNLPVDKNTLIVIVAFAILSIGYSAYAVWKIARSKPIQ